MTEHLFISDRHGRHVDGLEDLVKPVTVLVLAGDDFATPAAQQLVVCLVNLLCRLVGSVSAVKLALQEANLVVPLPGPCAEGTAAEQLIALTRWAVGDSVPTTCWSGEPCHVTICVGARPTNFTDRIDICVVGSGWRAWVGCEARRPAPGALVEGGSNPLGPYFAASFAAGEVFKRSRGLKRGRYAEDFGYSLWSGKEGTWADLADGSPIEALDLDPIYLIGAGAVGQGLHAVLAAARLHNAYLITIDDDAHDHTNLNRCFLAGLEDVGYPKIEAITRSRQAAGLDGIEFKGTLTQYLLRSDRSGLRDDVAALEAEDRYPVVISAVDKNTSRQDIQGLAPDLVIGGSTVGLSAKSNLYDMAIGTPCLACHNQPEDDGARLREIEQQVRSMSEDELRVFLEGKVESVENVIAYLKHAERCGELGEVDFRHFATYKTPEFSVSFVSMAAAVLLAGRLFARHCFPSTEPSRRRMSTVAFRNLATGDDALSQDLACRRCAAGGRLSTHL
jgi:ThiF family